MAYITQRLKVIQGTVSNGILSLDMEFVYPTLGNAEPEIYSAFIRDLTTLKDTPIDDNHVYAAPSANVIDKTVTNLGSYYKFNIEVRLENVLQDIRYSDGQFFAAVTLVFKQEATPVWIRDLMVPIQQSEVPVVKILYADAYESLRVHWRLQEPRKSVLAYEHRCYIEDLARGSVVENLVTTERKISDYITEHSVEIPAGDARLKRPLLLVFRSSIIGVDSRENGADETQSAVKTFSKDSYFYQPILQFDRVPLLVKVNGRWREVESAKIKHHLKTGTPVSKVIKSTARW